APEFVQGLIEALGSGDERFRKRAADTLGEMPEPNPAVIEALIRALEDPNDDFTYCVCRALGRIGPVAAARLVDISSSSRQMERRVTRALWDMAYPYHKPLVEAIISCTALSPEEKERVVRLINRLRVRDERVDDI